MPIHRNKARSEVARNRRSGSGLRSVFTALVVLAAVGAIVLWCMVKWEAWQTFQNDLGTYQGVQIGTGKKAVLYAVGDPETVDGPEIRQANGWGVINAMRVLPSKPLTKMTQGLGTLPPGKSVLDYDSWNYYSDDSQMAVRFDEQTGLVKSVSCFLGWVAPAQSCDAPFGLRDDMTEEEVRRALGKPDKEEVNGGGVLEGAPIEVTKTLYYDTIGLRLSFAKRKVDYIGKVAPTGDTSNWFVRHLLF